jgi:hypothetical protein
MNTTNPINDLKEIRKMMETSSKFLSLSGLSGISAGIIALIGSTYAWYLIDIFSNKAYHYAAIGTIEERISVLELQLIIVAITILVLAISFGFLFTYLSAKKKQHNLFTPTAFKLAWSLGLPLAFGGVFTILLFLKGFYVIIGASTLMFYGLSLLNASKYVHPEIKYLAMFQMSLSLLSILFLEYSLYFWAFGFGVLHIIYGSIMYYKYDRN